MKRVITITIDDGEVRVDEGDRYCAGLSLDEMIGHLTMLVMPDRDNRALYGMYDMKTQAEYDEIERKRAEKSNLGTPEDC